MSLFEIIHRDVYYTISTDLGMIARTAIWPSGNMAPNYLATPAKREAVGKKGSCRDGAANPTIPCK
jgi:hypothetical protein